MNKLELMALVITIEIIVIPFISAVMTYLLDYSAARMARLIRRVILPLTILIECALIVVLVYALKF